MATFQYLDGGNSEAQDRLASSFLFAQTSPGLAATGVLSGLAVTQTATASGSVLIASGAAPVQASVGTGVALLVNDTQATLDVFTAHPMGGLPRNDVMVFDSVTKTIAVIEGDPNATPDDPTVPDTACALARLRHAASATTIPTAVIDDLRVTTRLASVPDPAWTAYTPTLTNLTLGSPGGSISGWYLKLGSVMHVRIMASLGNSGFSVNSTPYFGGLPGTIRHVETLDPIGTVHFRDYSATTVQVGSVTLAGDAARLHAPNGSGVSSSNPFAFSAGDRMTALLTYEVA